MIQLIVGGVVLPQTTKDRYSCAPEILSTQLDMISGRRVQEVRGRVTRISYAYDTLEPEKWRALAAVLRSGTPFEVTYLPDDSDEMQTSTFLVESIVNPVFGFARDGKAGWHNISFALREVRPR